ncbi:MAG: efflux RND transporter permease subunit, partial [bacterium]|nr:efflux RND transporter permease subunit [bacterium]
MRNIVAKFIKYPFYANVLIIFIIVAGGMSFFSMKKSFFPERSNRDIVVTIAYPGASPKEMEEGLTVRIEEAVRSIVGIKEINSTSSENFAMVNITTTGEFDIDDTLMEVKNSVDAINSFPTDAEKPIVFKARTRTPAMWVGLRGDVDLLTLKKHATRIENDFLTSGVLSQVNVFGIPPVEISVEVTQETLLRYRLTFDEISRAIARNNRDISAGMIKSRDEEILIRSRARSVNPNVIADIILRAREDGSFLRIRDVAETKLKFSDVPNHSMMNGKRAVYFFIQKLANEDLQEISQYLHKYVDEFNAKDQGVKMEITFDFLSMLKSRLDLLYNNGGLGLILVIISLGLFLSTRLSFWVAWGIPASFLSMFVVAVSMGITINMISLFGMILVIGILVDDGIVIAENIYTHFEKGKSPKRAAIDGTMEVLPAVMTSVTTTIVAFSPLLFVEGRMEFMYEMAFVVIFSLGFSLVEAFLVLPAHVGSDYVLRSKKRAGRLHKVRNFLEKAVHFARYQLYGKLLKQIIKWKYIVTAIPLALFLITFGFIGGGFIQSTFFPAIPFDSFSVNIAFKPGGGEKTTLKYLEQFDKAVWQVNEDIKKELNDDKDYIRYTFISLGDAFDNSESGSHVGNVNIMLRDMEGCPISSFHIAEKVRKKVGKVKEARKFSISGRHRFGKPVSISLLGKNLTELSGAKEMLVRALRNIPLLKNITDNNAPGM